MKLLMHYLQAFSHSIMIFGYFVTPFMRNISSRLKMEIKFAELERHKRPAF
jgi:hypothetical protein